MESEKPYRDENWLTEQVRAGRTPAEIAEICEVSEATIERWIDRFNITPYQDEEWLESQVGQYVPARAIAEWCCVTENTVKRWMKRFGIDHPGLVPPDVMRSYLNKRFKNREEVPLDAQIIALRERFVPRVDNARVAEAVGCTPSYVREVVGEPGGELVDLLDYSEFSGSEAVSPERRKEILERDERRCVRCGANELASLEVHHIIPGESSEENLATLCRECHLEAHEGDFYEAGFSYDSRREFWNEWI